MSNQPSSKIPLADARFARFKIEQSADELSQSRHIVSGQVILSHTVKVHLFQPFLQWRHRRPRADRIVPQASPSLGHIIALES